MVSSVGYNQRSVVARGVTVHDGPLLLSGIAQCDAVNVIVFWGG
jgi:hypothetical protein